MPAQKRVPTEKQLAALKAHQWKQGGPSPNPSGRPASLAELIKKATRNGQEAVDVAVAILKGEIQAPASVRLDAVKWVSDRIAGRAPETVLTGDLAHRDPEELAAVTDSVLLELATQMRAERTNIPAPPLTPADSQGAE